MEDAGRLPSSKRSPCAIDSRPELLVGTLGHPRDELVRGRVLHVRPGRRIRWTQSVIDEVVRLTWLLNPFVTFVILGK